MLISELIDKLETLLLDRGDAPVYMQFKEEDEMYFSIERIFPDIVINPTAKKGEGRLAELIVLSNVECIE